MTIISKTAGGLSLASCVHDIHKTALINADKEYAKVSSDATIALSLGTQKANRLSYRDAQRKNFLSRSQFFISTQEILAKVGGYVKGFAGAAVHYIPNFILQGLALFSSKKSRANISTIALAGLEIFDFVKNSTNLTQRTDYLK